MASSQMNMPFGEGGGGYQNWRVAKLQSRPGNVEDIIVDIDSLESPGQAAIDAIKQTCSNNNMVVYRCRDTFADRALVKRFGSDFGLHRLDHHLCANDDGVSELSVAVKGDRAVYVPYSNRGLSWHTDGYYNEKSRQINSVILHCVQNAEEGGENALLDPEIAYILLRDTDPRFIKALEHPQCMTIPANENPASGIRASVQGPVFSYDSNGKIHMRYSARKKNIEWRDDEITSDARLKLAEILADKNGPVLRYRLQNGEGLISNNVLHNRTAFSDGNSGKRLLYRARYFECIKTS